jgi:hypothetical protein
MTLATPRKILKPRRKERSRKRKRRLKKKKLPPPLKETLTKMSTLKQFEI